MMLFTKTDVAKTVLKQTFSTLVELDMNRNDIRYIQKLIIGMAISFNRCSKIKLPIERAEEIAEDLLDQIYRAQAIDAKRTS